MEVDSVLFEVLLVSTTFVVVVGVVAVAAVVVVVAFAPEETAVDVVEVVAFSVAFAPVNEKLNGMLSTATGQSNSQQVSPSLQSPSSVQEVSVVQER